MIAKIKDLMKVRELIDEIGREVKSQERAVRQSSENLDDFKRQLIDMNKLNKRALDQMKRDAESFKEFRDELKKELYEFKLFKKEVQKKFKEEIEKELSEIKDTMQDDVASFNQTKKSLDSKLDNINRLEKEIQRLTVISKNLKASDFELVRSQKQSDQHGKEKLELLRKIEYLERLVAQMRRRR